MSERTPHFTDPELLALMDEVDVAVPRGEPRRQLAQVADALVTRAPEQELHEKLATAAETLWTDEARARVTHALTARRGEELTTQLEAAAGDSDLSLALAYRAALPLLARDECLTRTGR